jgi:type I restriction enzyme M protein
MNADDFRDYMLSFIFLRYLSSNYRLAAKELGRDYPVLNNDDNRTPLAVWYDNNADDVQFFEKRFGKSALRNTNQNTYGKVFTN